MKGLPRITVVTPTLNHGCYLEETIRSVVQQGYPNLEYIVMDGGSTDHSKELIRCYEDRISFWVSQPDRGQADALRKGFDRATGDILGWVNSSDALLPGSLEAVGMGFLKNPRVPAYVGDAWVVSPRGKLRGRVRMFPVALDHLLYERISPPQPACFFQRRFYERVGGLNSSLSFVMDYDLFLRLAQFGPFSYVPLPLARMRKHPDAKLWAHLDEGLQEAREVTEFYRARYPARFISLRRLLAIAQHAGSYLRQGAVEAALRLWIHHGLRTGPAQWGLNSMRRLLATMGLRSPFRRGGHFYFADLQ